MSDQVGSSGSSDGNGDRRGKRKYPIDEGKKPAKNQKWEPQTLSCPLAPSGLTTEDLNVFGMVSEQDGGVGLSDFMKQQELAFQHLEQKKNNPYPILDTSVLSQIGSERDTKDEGNFDDYDDGSFGWDDDDEYDYEPPDGLICELQLSESERLVIPTHMVYNDFPVLMHKPNPEDIFQLTDYLGREWEVTVKYDRAIHAYIITTGWSLYLQHHGLKPPDWVRFYKPEHKLHFNHFVIQHEKKSEDCTQIFAIKPITAIPAKIPVTASSQIGIKPLCLFKVVVTRSNRLRIFFDRAVGHLNPPSAQPPPYHLREYTIYLTDHLGQMWEMRYLRFQDEEAYIIVRGWEQYMAKHGLKHRDTIKFCWKYSKDGNSFLTIHEKRPNQQSYTQLLLDDELTFPQFLKENILCELRLSKADVEFGRLVMPDVEIPFLCRGLEMVKLTDQNNKHWYLIIVQADKGYMIIDGWEAYVSEFELEAGDMVRIYMPASSDHDKHFLIQCQKKRKEKTEEEKKEGERGSDKSGDGAALSQGGSSKEEEKL